MYSRIADAFQRYGWRTVRGGGMFNRVIYWAATGNGFLRFSDEPAPIVQIERLTGLTVAFGSEPKCFDLVVGPLVCDEHGVSGLAWRPSIDSDSWQRSDVIAGVYPVGWADWLDHLESLGISRNVLIGRGEPASIALWFSFQVWARERRGEQLAELLTQGAATIEEIQAIARGSETTDIFRQRVADVALQQGALPKRRRGRPATKTERVKRAVVELGALAADIRRERPALALLPSYEAACAARPEWVPATWRDGDNALRLAKEVEKLKGTRWHGWIRHG